MATLPELKKKLKSIRTTEKITKAMKSISAAKYSVLSHMYSDYSAYASQCNILYKCYKDDIDAYLLGHSSDAPAAVFVFSANKGMCGGFNTEILNFASEKIRELPDNTLLFPCGKKAAAYFAERKIPYEKAFVFSDVPSFTEAEEFMTKILTMRKEQKISSVYMIYPEYKNVIRQTPVLKELFTPIKTDIDEISERNVLFVPDKETVIANIADKIIFSSVYSVIIETALGAQASTLTTMRSAFDTASKYASQLEIQINRKRQSEVTADVIETTNKS